MKNMKILIVAAHPDDEILGCGGTIARLVKEGYEAFTLVLGEGITSRDKKRNRKKRLKEIDRLKKEIFKANKAIGVRKVFIYDFPDNRFDTLSMLDIVKVIEEVKGKIKPDIIFTHYEKDLNIDHQITYKAAITATRPLKEESVKEIYSFEIPSSTEWSYPILFSPDVFFDISRDINSKISAFKKYKNEIKRYPHPRSLEGIKITAQFWGINMGARYAEAFKAIRIMK